MFRSQERLWLSTEFHQALSTFKHRESLLELLKNDLNDVLFQARLDLLT